MLQNFFKKAVGDHWFCFIVSYPADLTVALALKRPFAVWHASSLPHQASDE
jgi:hypothetical protein